MLLSPLPQNISNCTVRNKYTSFAHTYTCVHTRTEVIRIQSTIYRLNPISNCIGIKYCACVCVHVNIKYTFRTKCSTLSSETMMEQSIMAVWFKSNVRFTLHLRPPLPSALTAQHVCLAFISNMITHFAHYLLMANFTKPFTFGMRQNSKIWIESNGNQVSCNRMRMRDRQSQNRWTINANVELLQFIIVHAHCAMPATHLFTIHHFHSTFQSGNICTHGAVHGHHSVSSIRPIYNATH